ncbi:hypothetical protein [Herbiconiux sp. YIM B11900]
MLSLLLGAVARARRRSQTDVLAHLLGHGRIERGVIRRPGRRALRPGATG